MTNETLSIIAAMVMSLIYSFFPGVKAWYAALDDASKFSVNVLTIVVMSSAIFLMSCVGITVKITCDAFGVDLLLNMILRFATAYGSTYLLTRKLRTDNV